MSNKICKVEGCERKIKCRGVCPKHYHKLQRYGDPTHESLRYKRIGAMCRVPGCGEKATAQELCPRHYTRLLRHGDPLQARPEHWVKADKEHKGAHTSYKGMVCRCNNPNIRSYKNYGGRNIKICDRWLGKYGFKHFLEDMGDRPEGCSLDRIDVDGDYCPENCRWADRWTQAANRRNHRENTGVFKIKNKWYGRMIVKGQRYEKGFLTRNEAVAYRKELEQRYLR